MQDLKSNYNPYKNPKKNPYLKHQSQTQNHQQMGSLSSSVSFLMTLLLIHSATSTPIHETFLHCLSHHLQLSNETTQLIYAPNTSSYTSLLQSSIRNLRFLNSTTPQPLLIVAPTNASHVQASVLCCKKHGLQMRIRSGGHDYEGLSYSSRDDDAPFIVVDLNNLRSISVNVEDRTAWVGTGATIGEVYYRIAEKSSLLGFPAGLCPTVGLGGHLSGGGIGTLMRKYGLAADNIIDAYLVDADGKIHDRRSMGESLFWAIRGGGAASFGVVLSWKIKLVHVPRTVTVFTMPKTLEQGATKLVSRWQNIADKLNEDLFIRIIIQVINEEKDRERTREIEVSFNSLFLGSVSELIPLMEESFPELGLKPKDCIEMSWIRSALYFSGYPYGERDPLDVLLRREPPSKVFFKAKSDFVRDPISEIGLEGIWKRFLEEEAAVMIMDPLGGRMSEISEAATPFPHRDGNLYNIQYLVTWEKEDVRYKRHIDWIRKLYGYMGPYVSKSPRAAYLNYRDLDLGRNKGGKNTSYSKASVWGRRYYKGNFKRLALVKGEVDPDNFFWNEQSIPPLVVW